MATRKNIVSTPIMNKRDTETNVHRRFTLCERYLQNICVPYETRTMLKGITALHKCFLRVKHPVEENMSKC